MNIEDIVKVFQENWAQDNKGNKYFVDWLRQTLLDYQESLAKKVEALKLNLEDHSTIGASVNIHNKALSDAAAIIRSSTSNNNNQA